MVERACHHTKTMRWWTGLSGWLLALPLVSAAADIDFSPCDRDYETPAGAQCARVPVPENPEAPEGRQISLNVMRVAAIGEPEGDPLFIIVGGPGGAAVRSASQYLPYFRRLQKSRDIIFIDQRGTGESNGLSCPLAQLEFASLTASERARRAAEIAADCVAGFAADLRYYTTPYAVEDLETLRQRLGYAQVNMWGVSYGTRVILQYMRRYPQKLRTAVLDGVAPVSIQLPRYVARDGNRALDLVLTRCEASPACAQAYGDLRSGWLNLLNDLAARPRELTLTHPRTQEPVPARLDASMVSGWVRLALYARDLVPLLPQAIQRAIDGDFTVLGAMGLLAMDDVAEHVSQGMQMAVLCAEDRQYPGAQQAPVQRERGLLWLNEQNTFDLVCRELPEVELPEGYFEPVQSDVPTLLLSGNYDPVTPPRWAEQVEEGLSNSRHLLVAGAHHGVTMQGCVARLVAQFVEERNPAALDAQCAEDIRPRPFFIDAAGPAMSAAALEGNAGTDQKEAP